MIVGGQTEARSQLSSTIIDYHEPFDQGLRVARGAAESNSSFFSLESTQEARVALGYRLWQLLRFFRALQTSQVLHNSIVRAKA